MSIRFGSDGTLYCNTVKYNYKQTRNLVADNGYNKGHWNIGACSIITQSSQMSQRALKFPAGNNLYMSTQVMPVPTANHKYYGCIWWRTNGSAYSSADNRFEWYYTDGDANNNLIFASKNIATNNQWVLLSNIVQAGNNPVQSSWIIRNFIVNGTTDGYTMKPIIVDLTECFGAGNEPSKEWCDNNVLEIYKITGYNEYSLTESNVNSSIAFSSGFTYSSTYNIAVGNQYFLNRTDIPRDYAVDCQSGTSVNEVTFTLPATTITSGRNYYMSMDLSQPNGNTGKSYDFYCPIAEPVLARVSQCENGQFNSGGGLYNWKRISGYNLRSNWTSGSYTSRFDFNNSKVANYLAITNFFKINANTVSQFSKTTSQTSIDRWFSGDSDCIIHIKNHLNKTIKFNGSYDIVCNDINIVKNSPIKMLEDGTIVCNNLIRVQSY